MRVSFGVWVAAGVVAGGLAAAAVVASGALDGEDGGSTTATTVDVAAEAEQRAADAEAFVAAYERSRTGTYVVSSTFRRTFPGGTSFTSEATVAQRPPDRLERGLGSITARVDGRVVLCSTTATGRYRCQRGRSERSYSSIVEREVEALRGYVDGDVPLYSVVADTEEEGRSCFDLEQVRPLPAPPYGTAARFCFDDETGALVTLRVERDEAVDLTEATEVRATVRERDLTPPRDGDRVPADQRVDGPVANEDADRDDGE
ncbi:MAG TPA: hypothetical protein PKA98_02680 [Acidimicrobiales bacterium]|nr:hypothetical protein [Acidimicrobiales bacterium]